MSKDKKKTGKIRKIVIVLVIIVVIIIVLAQAAKAKLSQVTENSSIVELQTAQVRDLSDTISVSGKVESGATSNVTSCASAEIDSIDVAVGDVVKAGDVICTLNKEDIQNQITALENAINSTSAVNANQASLNAKALEQAKADQTTQLAAAQIEIDNAQTDYNTASAKATQASADYAAKEKEVETAKKALDKMSTTDSGYLEAKTAYDTLAAEASALKETANGYNESLTGLSRTITAAQTNYAAVKNTTDQAIASAQNTVDMQGYTSTTDTTSETQLKDLKKQLEDCTLKAEIGGIITAVNVTNGDMYTGGAVIATIEDDSALVLKADVAETDILKLTEGMTATITSNAIEDKEYEGKITKVIKIASANAAAAAASAQGAEGATAATTYGVEIQIPDSDLLIGMSAKAKIVLSDKGSVLCVPYDMILEDKDGSKYVMRAKDNGDGTYTAEKASVEVGEEINYYTEITGGDLQEGDNIVFDTSILEGNVFTANPAEGTDAGESGSSENGEVVVDTTSAE